MDRVVRFGVSFDPLLLRRFDRIIKRKGYLNRSEALRDIVREYITREKKENVFGILKVVFDPRDKAYKKKVGDVEDEYHCLIININKKYLDHHTAVELIEVKGKLARIRRLVSKLGALPCVKEVKFEMIKTR